MCKASNVLQIRIERDLVAVRVATAGRAIGGRDVGPGHRLGRWISTTGGGRCRVEVGVRRFPTRRLSRLLGPVGRCRLHDA